MLKNPYLTDGSDPRSSEHNNPIRRPSARQRRSVLTLAAMLIFSGLAFVTTPVSAHGVEVNGCTAVPDSGYGFDFHVICDDHDRCYGTKPYGDGWRGRRACDRVFRSAMLDYCTRHDWFTTKRAACDTVAIAYYLGVRTFGWAFWQNNAPTPIA
jgi:hypothetical protein